MATQVLDTTIAAEANAAASGGVSFHPRPLMPAYPSRRRTMAQASRSARMNVRRRIPPTSGFALEKLGHAIEYLTDEYIRENCHEGQLSGQTDAIQLLMLLNREIYFECPAVEPAWIRILRSLQRAFDVREAPIR